MRKFEVTFRKNNYFTVPIFADNEQDAEGLAFEKLEESFLRYHRPYDENLEVVIVEESEDVHAM